MSKLKVWREKRETFELFVLWIHFNGRLISRVPKCGLRKCACICEIQPFFICFSIFFFSFTPSFVIRTSYVWSVSLSHFNQPYTVVLLFTCVYPIDILNAYLTTLLLLCFNIYIYLYYSFQFYISFVFLEFAPGNFFFYILEIYFIVSFVHKLSSFHVTYAFAIHWFFYSFLSISLLLLLSRSFFFYFCFYFFSVEFSIFTIRCMLRKYN